MSRKSAIRRAVPSALAIVVAVLSLVAGSGLVVLGALATQASGSHGSSGGRSPGWSVYDDGLRMLAGYETPRADLGADLQILLRRAPHQPIDHSYDDFSNVARTIARLEGYRWAPQTPRHIFRTGSQTDNALTDATGVSFRDSVSSSLDPVHPQVFRPGDKIWGVDTELLPRGAVVPDGIPAGHVTVNATPAQIRAAIAREGSPLEAFGLRPLDDPGAFRLPGKR